MTPTDARLILAPTLGPLLQQGDMTIRDALDQLAAMRFRFVQLSATQPGLKPRELDQSGRRDLLATLRRKELAVSGIDAWIPPAHFQDESKIDRAVGALLDTIDLAADLGRVSISLMLPEHAQAMATVIERAQHRGVELADHRVPIIAPKGVGIGIDPAAWLAAGNDPAAAITSNGPRIVSARLCDLYRTGMRGPIGDRHEGRLDVLAYNVALSVSTPVKQFIIDARQWNDPWSGLGRTVESWEKQYS